MFPKSTFECMPVRRSYDGRKAKGTEWLTPSSRFAAALRRVVSYSSANRFGAGALTDISRQTVVRSECDLICAVNSSIQSWYAQQEADIIAARHRCHEAGNSWDDTGFAVHVIKSDATNSNIIMNSKLQSTVVESWYLQSLEQLVRGVSLVDAASFRRAWTDTIRVGGSTAEDVAALVDKQLRCIGCTSMSSHVSGEPNPHIIRLFIYTSDGGPDQMKYRRACRALAADRLFVWWIDMSCLLHVHHLIVKDGMKIVNRWCRRRKKKWLYMSSLSKLVHCIRDLARPFFIEWKNIHGEASAISLAATKPPQCIPGRWGSIETTGHYCLERRRQIPGVVSNICKKKIDQAMPKLPGKTKRSNVPITDDAERAPLLDDDCSAAMLGPDTAQYRKTIGKWRQDTIDVINELEWWHVIEIAHLARAPLDHFYRWMHVHIEPGEPKCVQLLSTGKAASSSCSRRRNS